ncbi:hypothetical protein RRG08_033422 [Elysia crispata]|uniref:Uncharacterized protein n=1 Tax=Elysia crispata TaxID=231223 RepID=A0AAE1E527_9GAST|nr:hypothetical protein RRG08_033422 [Elysia crispata]
MGILGGLRAWLAGSSLVTGGIPRRFLILVDCSLVPTEGGRDAETVGQSGNENQTVEERDTSILGREGESGAVRHCGNETQEDTETVNETHGETVRHLMRHGETVRHLMRHGETVEYFDETWGDSGIF